MTEIISGCKRNDRKAQEAIYHHMYRIMMPIIRKATNGNSHDVAEEIFNNGMLRVYKGIDQFNNNGSFEGWCRRICMHAITDHLKASKQYRQDTVFYEKYKGTTETDGYTSYKDHYANNLAGITDISPCHGITMNQVLGTILKSTPNKKVGKYMMEIFKKHTLEGYTHKELGKMFSLTEGTCKWYLNQAREVLRKKYTVEHFVN